MGSSSPSHIVLSCVMPVPPYMTGKTFSPYPRPLGPCKAPPHPVKLYFLLICPTTSTIFLMKPISLIKVYLKLQLNLSHEIKSIFRKKLNNIFKCLTRQSIYIKKKIKPISLIKIYLKLQLNLSHEVKSIFIKKIK